MNDSMATLLTVEDPEGINPVTDAYCAITEVHANYRTKSLIVVFECWRSRLAFEAKRKPFTAIQIRFEPDKGGSDFFDKYGIDGAVGANILKFCIANSDVMKDAITFTPAAPEGSHE